MSGTHLIFLGPPGSGKGTQAARLAEKYGLVPLSSGDALRKERQLGTEIGQKAAQFMDAGTLVPDEVVTGVMLAALQRLGTETGFILDGFPRTVPQAEALDQGFEQAGMKLDAVVDFKLDDAEIIRRIVQRRVCGECGATYNLSFLPPKVDGVCDKCGKHSIIQRKDDREDVVRTRLATYRAQTAPLVEYYAARGVLHAVDSSQGAEAVAKAVARILEQTGRA